MTDHPYLIDSSKRLSILERRTPPGYPLGYLLNGIRNICAHCGSVTESTYLMTRWRHGASGHRAVPTHPQETIYALPVDRTVNHHVTPRCDRCIESAPAEPVPRLPQPGAITSCARDSNRNGREPEIDLRALGLIP